MKGSTQVLVGTRRGRACTMRRACGCAGQLSQARGANSRQGGRARTGPWRPEADDTRSALPCMYPHRAARAQGRLRQLRAARGGRRGRARPGARGGPAAGGGRRAARALRRRQAGRAAARLARPRHGPLDAGGRRAGRRAPARSARPPALQCCSCTLEPAWWLNSAPSAMRTARRLFCAGCFALAIQALSAGYRGRVWAPADASRLRCLLKDAHSPGAPAPIHPDACAGGARAGAGMARSKEWWKALLGMLMQQRLVRAESRQGGRGGFTAVVLSPEARAPRRACWSAEMRRSHAVSWESLSGQAARGTCIGAPRAPAQPCRSAQSGASGTASRCAAGAGTRNPAGPAAGLTLAAPGRGAGRRVAGGPAAARARAGAAQGAAGRGAPRRPRRGRRPRRARAAGRGRRRARRGGAAVPGAGRAAQGAPRAARQRGAGAAWCREVRASAGTRRAGAAGPRSPAASSAAGAGAWCRLNGGQDGLLW